MPEPVQVAIHVYASDWGLRGHGSRQIDWLVDGTLLHRDNVVFVFDKPISPEYRKALQAQYRIHDATWQHYKWGKFLEVWSPKHWVSYNDFHPRHKIRNRILRDAGCQTWHYSHSINLPPEGYPPWKELDYDHLVCWNETDAAQFEGGQKHILGPLFASQVPQLVIALFDSTWDNYPSGLRDKFFSDMYALLDRLPKTMMLYKPKLKPPPMPTVKNFYVLPEWIEPALVIGCADLTIGLACTSPVIEAQGAGKRAIWYDPATQSPDDVDVCLMKEGADPAQRFRELLAK
jgi:hypothetical protein